MEKKGLAAKSSSTKKGSTKNRASVLQLFAEPSELPEYWKVFWRLHPRSSPEMSRLRRLDLKLPYVDADAGILAELIALRYLLLERQMLGRDCSGRSVLLVVSKGAIRKLNKLKSTKHKLQRYGRFLQIRFAEAQITVDKDNSWTKQNPEEAQFLAVDGPVGEDHESVETSAGPVVLTRHAVERFAERLKLDDLDAAWRQLRGSLRSKPLVKIKGPARAKEHGNSLATVWRARHDKHRVLDFVFVKEEPLPRVVTVKVRSRS